MKEDEMTSERKRAANQRNAKRSTGSKDTGRTKFNARKHGLLSKAAIIQNGAHKEDQHELDSLLEAYWEDFRPEGTMEESLVDEIVNCVWRKRRALRWEALIMAQNPFGAKLLEKILRYETTIDRQMSRALKQLGELQAARRAHSGNGA
jgi:hypothetical protein